MKKKLPALLLAVGMTASPIFAKKANRKSDDSQYSKIEQNNTHRKKRLSKSALRHQKLEAEKELIKETEQEISEALVSTEVKTESKKYKSFKGGNELKVVIKDKMPSNGIDISDEFRIIHKSETS